MVLSPIEVPNRCVVQAAFSITRAHEPYACLHPMNRSSGRSDPTPPCVLISSYFLARPVKILAHRCECLSVLAEELGVEVVDEDFLYTGLGQTMLAVHRDKLASYAL